jgi:hypothetical protein
MNVLPVHDIIGGSLGFRRPGYIISFEPGITYSFKKFSVYTFAPIALTRNRTQSMADKITTINTGNIPKAMQLSQIMREHRVLTQVLNGVSGKLNLLFGIPYVETKASAGTLHGMKGVQDLSLFVKWMPVETQLGEGTISLYGVGGISFPVNNYTPDFLPMSIGLHSTNLTLRGMVDYQVDNFFATVSGTYVARSNIKIDRTSYYTTEIHATNEVAMPDASNLQLRTGYRSGRMIAEAILNNWTTLGGFDITRNNMPFPSNKMNATTAGINVKYNLAAVEGLSLIGGGSVTLAGRNMGQAGSINAGVFYIFDFAKKTKKSTTTEKAK